MSEKIYTMNGIQLFQNSQATDIIQMMWNGHVTCSDVEQAFFELQQLVTTLTDPANLVVIVSADTQLPSVDTLETISYKIQNNNLAGWMVIGNNSQANATISHLVAGCVPNKE